LIISYIPKKKVGVSYVALYVNIMLLIGNNMNSIKEVKKNLSSKFNMKDLGAEKLILRM
jgi:hypothetical protein